MSRGLCRRAGATALIAAATFAAAAAPAGAVVTFGSGLRAPSTGYYDSCVAACTAAQVDLPGSRVTSPVTGTVKKFRLRTAAGSDPQTIRFRVLRSADGVKFTGVGTSAAVALPTRAATTEFPVNMPIQAGDIIGVDLPAGGRRANIIATNGSAFQAGFFPTLGDGAPARASGNPRGSTPVRFDVLLQADVEISPNQTPKACTNVVQRRVKLRRGKKTRLRMKLSRAQIRALVKQAQPGATLIPVRVIVSFRTRGRPIARFVDIPVRIKRR